MIICTLGYWAMSSQRDKLSSQVSLAACHHPSTPCRKWRTSTKQLSAACGGRGEGMGHHHQKLLGFLWDS